MALAEFLRQIDLEEMAKGLGETLRESRTITSDTTPSSNSESIMSNTKAPQKNTTNVPRGVTIVQSNFQHGHEKGVFVPPSITSPRRRAGSPSLQEEEVQRVGGRNKRRTSTKRNSSAAESRQRLNGLIDELWRLIPGSEKEKRNLRNGQVVSRTEKLEMAVEVLKQLQDLEREKKGRE